jgi:MFS family permease
MSTLADSSDLPPAATLSADSRAHGRRLAITSHPAGMIHRLVYTDQLPTLALVALGASETVVGLQRAFEPVGQLLQLPTLRLVGRFRKRSILIAGQVFAVVAGLPLVAFGILGAIAPPWPVVITLGCLASASAGVVVSQTVWFPLLRSYVEPERIGQFFGLLRTGWHLTLIAYFVLAQRWLASWPGSFGLLFLVATACGLLRIAFVARLPEPAGETGERILVREAVALLGRDVALRRYLLGVSLCGAARRALVPFVIVMMRRVLLLSDADVILSTIAFFAGGFVSLYLWGKAVDRFGAAPVFQLTGTGLTGLYLCLLAIQAGDRSAALMIVFFFLLALLNAGFGVADTHVLFGLAPVHAPTRTLVVADVTSSLAYGLAPFAAGLLLDAALSAGIEPLAAYHGLFVAAAALTLLSLWPLARFR